MAMSKIDVTKAFEGLMPQLVDIIQNQKFSVLVTRIAPNAIEFTRSDGASFEVTDEVIDMLKMSINIASLVNAKK